uniref:ArsR/SmtB family transcription factor n=1 Tax=uncultured Sphaerotilus sp. TaxID=474984 RepID=UPI0030CA5462
MTAHRAIKNHLYEQVARIGKAMASPKRLELVELLCQGEKTVETLAAQADISVKLTSAHLRELRLARLVETRKDGKYVLYRLSSTSVADLWVGLRTEAEARLAELQVALANVLAHGQELEGIDRQSLLQKA